MKTGALLPVLLAVSQAATATAASRIGGTPSSTTPRPQAVDPLTLYWSATVPGGIAVAATCINCEAPGLGGPTGGVLDLADLPAGAAVQRALLYWSVLSVATPVTTGAPTMDGVLLVPTLVGEIADTPCFDNQEHTGIFRADVTSLGIVPGPHVLAGFPGTGTETGDITEGATLFVVYCAAGSPETDVVIYDGVDVVRSAVAPFTQAIGGFVAAPTGPVRALVAGAIGNGQGRDPIDSDVDPFIFDGVDLDAIDRSILSGALCPPLGLYDRTAVDVTGLVAPGDTAATLTIRAQGDCYSIGAIALAVETVPGRAVVEPSALDLRPGATPLLVVKAGAGASLLVTWEDVGASASNLYRGTIGAWYDHGETGACGLASASAALSMPAGDAYFLACAVGCGGGESSLGRDSFGRPRPSALAASGRRCP